MKTKIYLPLFILIFLFLISCEPLEPIPQSLSATIREIENNVQIKRVDEQDFEEAYVNDKVEIHYQIKTNQDSRSRVDLSSGTIVRIAPNSLFILEENHEKEEGLWTRIKMNAGVIWVILNGGDLEVETPSGLAAVRGSYMSAGYNPESGAVRITCLEGQCAAKNETGSVEFGAGEAADLPADGGAPVKGEMTEAEYQQWAENVPEATSLLPPEIFATETPPPTSTASPTIEPTATYQPQLGACTLTSSYLYIRACPEADCEMIGYAELDDKLEFTSEAPQGVWRAVTFEEKTGWINSSFCE